MSTPRHVFVTGGTGYMGRPRTRDTGVRLYPVTLEQMVAALVAAVESPASGVRIVEAPEIRQARV
jgi:thioester reductase-like protein